MAMFCYQCEQAAGGTGCVLRGVCGKDPEVSALQDLLVHAVQGIAVAAGRAREAGRIDETVDAFIPEALYATVTNVNFDPERLEGLIRRAGEIKARAEALGGQVGEDLRSAGGPAGWVPAPGRQGLMDQARQGGLEDRRRRWGTDVAGLQDLVLYGLKGMAAYVHHARRLGREDGGIYGFFHEVLGALAAPMTEVESLLQLALRVGEMNLKAMEMLDAAHAEAFGSPTPAAVRIEPRQGKAILVSGHDLKDLDALLRRTAGGGIRVYTHGEMLPAHGYPALRHHEHLAGNYGGAWQDQQREFEAFPGAILMTTNCIQEPRPSYRDRIFTTGPVAWPGIRHLQEGMFDPLIEAALRAPGFPSDGPDRRLMVGFGHRAVRGVLPQVVEAVRSGRIRHFFLIGGCDGARPGRNYYTEFAESVPADSVILTLACGKYRFNKKEFGTIDGIPRLLDVGQCNDAYSAIRIAAALAEALGREVNRLPLTLVLSWYEQKVVGILLTLLHLGIRNIRIGPTRPAFLSEVLWEAVARRFDLKPITAARADLEESLAGR